MFKRIKKWFTIDHVVDLGVDLFLILYDVITHPILIIMRILRHFIGEWFTDKIKAGVRWIAHWFERKRAYRLEHGYGIWRTYWRLILLSPMLIFRVGTLILFLVTGIEIVGFILDLTEESFTE